MPSSDAIYHYSRKIDYIRQRLEATKNGKIGKEFLDALADHGLSNGRVKFYGDRLSKIMKWFDDNNLTLKEATKEDCRACLRKLIGEVDAGETKSAYALALKRLIHFSKTGEIGEEKDDKNYVDEVRWIHPYSYKKQGVKQEVMPSDLLSPKEIEAFVEGASRRGRFPARDKAMVLCLYEGAFRPGELLRMTIGGIQFKDKLALVTTSGKTGSKTVPLLLAYKPLLEWIEQHPLKSDLSAPVWIGMTTNEVISYEYLGRVVKEAAIEAGLKKRVWNYLFRHTKLTDVARKHPDQILNRFGNWRGNTRQKERYIHLSSADLEGAVLREHGLLHEDKKEQLTLKQCPRCSETNTIGVKRCIKCGYILDEELAIRIAQKEQDAFKSLTKRMERQETTQKKILSMLDVLAKNTNHAKQEDQDD